ncbi:hypothetical protein SAMN02910342_00241 [Butyrivibrio sp. INlla21]|nr:hypothetical protein SAMN02910342_00241 [Butyrivibrio sp. INlla21]
MLEQKIKLIDKTMTNIDKLQTKYDKKFVDDLNDIGRQIISDFYSSYEPHLYHRKGSLKDVFRVTMSKDHVLTYEFSESFLTASHRVSNEYIYDIAFIKGWHGGAPKSSYQWSPVDSQTLYYRDPPPGNGGPAYVKWGRVAERTESPRDRMVEEMDASIEQNLYEMQKQLDDITDYLKRHL